MRAQEFIQERETVPFQGIDMSLEVEKDDDYVDDDDADNQLIHVRAMSGGRELGHVLFTQDYDSQGLVLNPQDLEVDERYRGQGIAAAMYDYVKSQGYRIRRSGQQTDAGAGFWSRHRPDSNVWEQGVTAGSVTKKPQPYNEPNWAKKLPKEKLNALAGPRYKKDKKEQGVSEGQLDPYRLERLDPQTRRVLQRMADHAEPGSWLSASEAYAMMLGLQYKNRDPRGWEQEVQHYVDLYRQYSGQGISEVKILSKVKGKGSEPGQLPRFGRPIAPGDETRYLGTKVADWQGREIWRDYLGGQLSYHLFDPDTRTVIVTTFGSRYKMNPRSYIIHGLYAAPGNPVRAAEFYRALVRDLGLTLISDRKQSPGGNKVWQQLEQFPDVEVYGYDTNTDTALNFGAKDVEMYTVPSAAVAGSKEMQRVARDLRLVATAR
jgi:GNAT superfamily N-acetyltransferase